MARRIAIVRNVFFWIHLVLAIAAGLVIALLCLTGAALAFEKQIIASAEPSVIVSGERLPADELMRRVAAIDPAYAAKDASFTFYASPTTPTVAFGGRDKRILVDPYTGESLGEGAVRTRAVFRWITQLHRWLALNGDGSRPVGRGVTGAANLLFVIVIVTGLFIWLPRQMKWSHVRAVLIPRWRFGTAKSREFNWHNTLGIWSVVPLLLMAASGTVISYAWAGNLLVSAVGTSAPPAATTLASPATLPSTAPATADGDAPSSPIEAMLDRAEALGPDWRLITLRLPGPTDAFVNVSLDRGLPGQPQHREQLVFSRVDGSMLKHETFVDLERTRRARLINRFLHTGEVLGVPGQFVFGLASFAGVVLAYTGFALSSRRFFAWRRRRRRAESAV